MHYSYVITHKLTLFQLLLSKTATLNDLYFSVGLKLPGKLRLSKQKIARGVYMKNCKSSLAFDFCFIHVYPKRALRCHHPLYKGEFFLEIKIALVVISHIWISRQSLISNCKELSGSRGKIKRVQMLTTHFATFCPL